MDMEVDRKYTMGIIRLIFTRLIIARRSCYTLIIAATEEGDVEGRRWRWSWCIRWRSIIHEVYPVSSIHAEAVAHHKTSGHTAHRYSLINGIADPVPPPARIPLLLEPVEVVYRHFKTLKEHLWDYAAPPLRHPPLFHSHDVWCSETQRIAGRNARLFEHTIVHHFIENLQSTDSRVGSNMP